MICIPCDNREVGEREYGMKRDDRVYKTAEVPKCGVLNCAFLTFLGINQTLVYIYDQKDC